MKNLLNDELIESVTGGKVGNDAGERKAPAMGKGVPKVKLRDAEQAGGTEICPVCKKRYDTKAPHICSGGL